MNIADVTAGLAARLHNAVGQVYEWAPSGQPEVPCAIIEFPEVESYHTDFGHEITTLTGEIRVLVGRGDSSEALRQLGEYVSTDTDRSLVGALEEPATDEDPWLRLRVTRTDTPRDDGDSVAVSFYYEISA